MSLEESYKILRKGAEVLALQNAQTKNRVLKFVKEALDKNRQKILAENADDDAHGNEHGGEGQDLHLGEDLQVLLESGALFQLNLLLPK